MRNFSILALGAAGATASLIATAPTAAADPGGLPCTFQLAFLCSMVPALPNLDHDVDLTQDPNALNGATEIPAAPPIAPSG
jgi:hypothetical protein